MLTFAEEIFLLSLDDTTGKISLPGGNNALAGALAGAVLCELSFLNRIDSDQKFVVIVDSTETGMPMLDEALDMVMAGPAKKSIDFWLERLRGEASRIKEMVIEELLEREIIKQESNRIFWVFPSRRYPLIDNEEIKDVERRLIEILNGTEIPSPRECALISIVQACGMFEQILSPKEYNRLEERIGKLAQLDMFGQEIIRLQQEKSK